MQLNKIADPRSPVHKYSRKELQHLARLEGRTDIEEGMPAELIRRRFMENPPAQWPRPIRDTLGNTKALRVPPFEDWKRSAFAPQPQAPLDEEVIERSALDDLEAQWKAQQKPASMSDLRAACKARGIKTTRTDTKADLEAKLNGQNAA